MLELAVYQSRFAGFDQQPVTTLPIEEATRWRRSHSRKGGDEFGRFRMSGSFAELQRVFDSWLGYHVVERNGRQASWQGYVHELVLHHEGMKRSISLQEVYNCVAVPYERFVPNGRFQELDPTTPVFTHWVQNSDGGTFSAQMEPSGANQFCRLSYGSSALGNSYIEQIIPVDANTTYLLELSSRGDGTNAARVEVLDNLTLGTIIAKTELQSGSAWQHDSFEFRTTFSQTAVKLRIYVPKSSGYGEVDDVLLKKYNETPHLTEWMINHASIRAYGQREYIPTQHDPQTMTLAEAETYRETLLEQHQWPTATPLEPSPSQETYLEIVVVGYWTTTYFEYNKRTSFHSVYLHHALIELLEQCDLEEGHISQSAMKCELVGVAYGRYERIGTLLERILLLAEGELGWQISVSDGRQLTFAPIEPEPTYYEDNGRFLNKNRLPQPVQWLRAGVVGQSLHWPNRRTKGTLRSNQFIINSIEVEPFTGLTSWE